MSQDLAALREALADAARASFNDLKLRHPGEHFYVFVLYTEPLLGYVGPSANTDEALARNGTKGHRWTPQSWDYHGEGLPHFVRAQALLEAFEPRDGDSEDEQDRHWNVVWSAFVEALQVLDRQGVFASGEARDEILVNVMWGDQDVLIFLETAERLNPRDSFLAYARDMLPGLRSMTVEMGRYPAAQEPHRRATALLARLQAELGE